MLRHTFRDVFDAGPDGFPRVVMALRDVRQKGLRRRRERAAGACLEALLVAKRPRKRFGRYSTTGPAQRLSDLSVMRGRLACAGENDVW